MKQYEVFLNQYNIKMIEATRVEILDDIIVFHTEPAWISSEPTAVFIKANIQGYREVIQSE